MSDTDDKRWGPMDKLKANAEYAAGQQGVLIDVNSLYPAEYLAAKAARERVQRERDAAARIACRFLLSGNLVYALREAKYFRSLDRKVGRMMEGKDNG
jgi:hypothetical protein